MKQKKEIIPKEKSFAFGKDIYLLGKDKDDIKYWLEGPKWDCNWYWAFGYVETYTNNDSPATSRDINSHEHIQTSFMGWQFNSDIPYINNIYESPKFTETTFTEDEGWKLSELFKTFYHLKEGAELFGRGGMHITNNPCKQLLTKPTWVTEINEYLIPVITVEIIKILSPE